MENERSNDRDSSGGRISEDRRLLTNRALDLMAVGQTLAGIAKVLDRAEPDRRRSALFDLVDQCHQIRENLIGTEDLLRMIAERGAPFPLAEGPESKVPWRERFWRWIFG